MSLFELLSVPLPAAGGAFGKLFSGFSDDPEEKNNRRAPTASAVPRLWGGFGAAKSTTSRAQLGEVHSHHDTMQLHG